MALPDKDTIQTATSSFMGLQSYTEEQAGSFFGRDAEIENLTTLINSNTLTIVFGKSGTGKTSLLNAGVFPKLHKNYCLPFRIRLNFNEDSPDLITQIKSVLKTEIDKYGFKVKNYPGKESLWEYFHKEPLWKSITPILIFDQFEEVFTLAGKNPNLQPTDMAEFWTVLSNLAENSIPETLREQFRNRDDEVGYNYKKQKVKIVFAFREEFLPEFESISRIIPSIKTSRFRLMPMNGHQALEVITKTWKKNIQSSEARQIVSYLTNSNKEEKDYDLMAIEPSLLSQVCAYIDKERISGGYSTISADFLHKYPKETILRSIYEEAVEAAGNKVHAGQMATAGAASMMVNPVKVFLEDKLITTEGYRTRYSLGVNDEAVRPGIDELKERYFIREDEKSVELTHDVLTPLIKKDREKRRKNIVLAAERKKARRKALLVLILASILAAGTYAFVTYKATKDKIETEKKVKELKDSYLKDSLKLNSLQQSIIAKEAEWANARRQTAGSATSSGEVDSAALQKAEGLKFELANLRLMYNNLEEENRRRQQSLHELAQMVSSPYTTSPVEAIRIERELYQQDNAEFQNALAKSTRKYDSLLKLYLVANALLQRLTNVVDNRPQMRPVDTSNALQLDLFYSKAQRGLDKPDANTSIYIIPYDVPGNGSKNRRIIRQAKIYEIDCDEASLNEADGIKKSRYYNGKFVLEDVPPGKYFVKICGYYGNYFDVTKESSGSVTEIRDASPPIR